MLVSSNYFLMPTQHPSSTSSISTECARTLCFSQTPSFTPGNSNVEPKRSQRVYWRFPILVVLNVFILIILNKTQGNGSCVWAQVRVAAGSATWSTHPPKPALSTQIL
ncbi:hypothetical protein BDV23DRAFT_153440 [Aspergillus alliaceus]|uniref:Uncharacterized protein n=1 Tax=Petromyces alliaceus TaxID=209559 RepID=A0A5N7CBS2_PETAA|nr:hypothetical protein BDV23DRAFT_153440 [Aspergillus alliaceus]